MSQPGTWLSRKGSLVRSGRGEPSPASRPLAGLGENCFPSRSLVCNTGMTTPASRAAGSRRWQVLGDYGHTESWGWGLLLQGWQKCSPSGPRRGQGALPQRRPRRRGSLGPWRHIQCLCQSSEKLASRGFGQCVVADEQPPCPSSLATVSSGLSPGAPLTPSRMVFVAPWCPQMYRSGRSSFFPASSHAISYTIPMVCDPTPLADYPQRAPLP